MAFEVYPPQKPDGAVGHTGNLGQLTVLYQVVYESAHYRRHSWQSYIPGCFACLGPFGSECEFDNIHISVRLEPSSVQS